MKKFNLNVDDKFRGPLREGASHVAVEYLEFNNHCNGDVVAVGTQEECEAANYPTLVVVPVGATAHFAVWSAEHVAPLLAAEQEATP